MSVQTAEENAFDEEAAVKELDSRMTKLEGQMSDLLTTIKDGFELWKLPRKLRSGHFTMRKSAKGRMEAHLSSEAQSVENSLLRAK